MGANRDAGVLNQPRLGYATIGDRLFLSGKQGSTKKTFNVEYRGLLHACCWQFVREGRVFGHEPGCALVSATCLILEIVNRPILLLMRNPFTYH